MHRFSYRRQSFVLLLLSTLSAFAMSRWPTITLNHPSLSPSIASAIIVLDFSFYRKFSRSSISFLSTIGQRAWQSSLYQYASTSFPSANNEGHDSQTTNEQIILTTNTHTQHAESAPRRRTYHVNFVFAEEVTSHNQNSHSPCFSQKMKLAGDISKSTLSTFGASSGGRTEKSTPQFEVNVWRRIKSMDRKSPNKPIRPRTAVHYVVRVVSFVVSQ